VGRFWCRAIRIKKKRIEKCWRGSWGVRSRVGATKRVIVFINARKREREKEVSVVKVFKTTCSGRA